MREFASHEKGFAMTFSNGVRISVQFGVGNYCSNKFQLKRKHGFVVCRTAEIAIMPVDDKDGSVEWFNFGCDTVKGWVSPDEVADWIAIASGAESFEELREHEDTILLAMRERSEEE